MELSEVGLKQAAQLGEYLSQKKIKAVYCSPLQRAYQTAEAVASRQGLKPQPVEDLTDLDFGEWEGMPRLEVKAKYPETYRQWATRPDMVEIPGGESLANVRKRVLVALDDIIQKDKDSTVALVTHRVITKVLICALLGLDDSHFWNIEQDTCGATTFNHNGRIWVMTHHNESHFIRA